jgi:hypothetical protein
MEQITHYITIIREQLLENPWVWHLIQGFMLLTFFPNKFIYTFPKSISKFLNFFATYHYIYLILFIFNKIEIWGIIVYAIVIIIDKLFKKSKQENDKSTSGYSAFKVLWESSRILLIGLIIFSLNGEFSYKYRFLILLIYLYYITIHFIISSRTRKYEIQENFVSTGYLSFFSPKWIGLVLIPFSWAIWILMIMSFFEKTDGEIHPKFDLANRNTLIDDWKNNSSPHMLYFMLNVCAIIFLGFSIDAFVLIGLINFILYFYYNRKSNNPLKYYISFSIITGNQNYLNNLVISKKITFLVQRILIKITENSTYGVLVSPYEKVVNFNKVQHIDEISKGAHHLVLIDGGEESDKIIRIENDFNYFLGRVDTVIDYFSIANQQIDEYSKPIESKQANCIRERIAVKQAIIDEKAFVLDDNPEEEAKTIDTFINSINTESVRINMLVREYYKENTIDYEQLQSELINKGPFEINTLLRQMREGGSVPSRFVDALSIAEVAARYLFSLTNEVNNYLNKNENSIEDRNKLKQLSFGPCVGFLRSNIIDKKSRDLNEFEKTVKELLEIKYTDSDNFERLKKYLITDLHYDKDVKDEPALFELFNYLAYIRNKTRGHGTPSKVEFEFYVTLDLISIFIVNCISKIEIETFSRQTINEKEWLLYYNAGGNVVLHPLEPNENLEYWKDSFDWKYLDKMEEAKKQIDETNQSVYFKIKHQEEIHWIKAETYFKCKEGIIYMYDGINNNEAEWISFTTGAVIRPYRIN